MEGRKDKYKKVSKTLLYRVFCFGQCIVEGRKEDGKTKKHKQRPKQKHCYIRAHFVQQKVRYITEKAQWRVEQNVNNYLYHFFRE